MAQTPGQIMQAKKVADVLGVTVPDKITSGDLKGTPTTPTVTPTSVDTTTPGVLGAVESSMDQFTKMAQENKKNAQQVSDTSRTAYTDRLKTTPTESELTATQYETQGVNTAQKELDDINSQLQVEQNALRREMERIQDNKTGASMGQVQNMVNEAESKSLRKQADLAVIQMGLQGKFNTAKAIADRAVDASMEREKNILEALKINYEDNKALFTTAEQREFDTLLSDRERKYNEELAGKKAISDYSIEAMKMGAGSDIINAIRGAKTPEEAQAIAAEYMSPIIQLQNDLDVLAKRASINASNSLSAQRTSTSTIAGVEYTNDMDALTGNVTAMIPTKFGQEQFQRQMASARNDADRLNLIAGQVLKSQPAEVRRDFANQAVGLKEIDNAIQLIDEGTKTGVFQAGAQYVYNIVGKDYDPKLAQINQHLTAAIQPYRNSVTGAAWGNQEDGEYAQLFGSTKYSPEELRSRLVILKEVLKSKSATTLNAFANPMGVGDNQFESGPYSPIPNQNTQSINDNDPLGIL